MAINWSAYEAAKELYGTNKENIQDIGSRFPLFARSVMAVNSDYLLDILKALPKVTARVVESGLKEMEVDDIETDTEEAQDEAPQKKTEKKATKKNKPEVDEDEKTYESMTSKELYQLCCERGISSKCKNRKKETLIDLLERYDNGEFDEKPEKKEKKAEKKVDKKPKSKQVDDWDEDEDDWEEEEETDPYVGKSARELYKMCVDRGIKTKVKLSADAYAKLLKKADEEAEAEEEDTEDDGDEWEI